MLLLTLAGCVKVGPDFAPPDARLAEAWLAADDPRLITAGPVDPEWWRSFDDPTLSELVRNALEQNPTLQMAACASCRPTRSSAPRPAISTRRSSRRSAS